MIYYKDRKHCFIEYFNELNGMLIRSNVIENQKETNDIPLMRSFPELLDIGIMGHCIAAEHGVCSANGVDCYQNAPLKKRENMKYEDYLKILRQCSGKVFQIALGGAGDPNKHENFEAILNATREYRIVPNLTTSGHQITQREIAIMREHCGAVAVSYYSKLDEHYDETNPQVISTILDLIDAGCTTNIHYVLSKDTVDDAIIRIKNGLFPNGVNAIIFLLYKPVGLADKSKMLSVNDSSYLEFLKLIESNNCHYKVGMDSCQAPALYMFNSKIAKESIEFCEAARFSMYIDCELIAFPCSFGHAETQYAVDLNSTSILKAWNSHKFDMFRSRQKIQCSGCDVLICRNCSLDIGINVCGRLKNAATPNQL